MIISVGIKSENMKNDHYRLTEILTAASTILPQQIYNLGAAYFGAIKIYLHLQHPANNLHKALYFIPPMGCAIQWGFSFAVG